MAFSRVAIASPITVLVVVSLLALQGAAKDVAVEGTVMCQCCEKRGTWDLEAATPLRGAEIRVECKDANGKQTYKQCFFTDFNGYFYASLMGVQDLNSTGVKCKARLRSSPESECDELTNVGAGFNGAPVSFLKHLDEADLYTVGPFAFLPSSCAGNEGKSLSNWSSGKGFSDWDFSKIFGDGDFHKQFGNGDFHEQFGNGDFGGHV